MSARFLSTQGVPLGNAVLSGMLVSFGGFTVQVMLLVLALTVFDVQLDLDLTFEVDDQARLILLVVVGVGVILSLIWFIPKLHKRVVPHVGAAWRLARGLVTNPRRLAMVVGGNMWSQVTYAVVLGLCTKAYGYHVGLGTLIVINTCATLFAGIMPVPGGMGVTEAALTAGLTAAGVPPAPAAAAALTHRVVTFYLPPTWGWFALRWLTRRGYV